MDKLKSQIEELLYENAPDFKIAKLLKSHTKEYFETLDDIFATSGGKDFLYKHTKRIDTLIKMIYKIAYRAMFKEYAPLKNSLPVTLVALGSYGREQLCVHSDIDLMIVYEEIAGYNTKEFIEKILYICWDSGLKLGHRVHTVDELYEVSKTDITIKTALIESRFIEGSNILWTKAQNQISKIRNDDITKFIDEKLQEQQSKHQRYPLTMEPNLKDGVGGFRDANLVFWIGKAIYNVNSIKELPKEIVDESEYKPFRIALEFLFRVRSALHLATHKKEDKLHLELIPIVSRYLGYKDTPSAHMKFAKKVTESLKVIRLYTTIWIYRLTKDYIKIEKNYAISTSNELHIILQELNQKAKEPFIPHPMLLSQLINASKPDRLDKKLYSVVSEMFEQKSLYSILYTLSYARMLKYTIPPMKKVVDLPQFDGYHHYAVDIHSIKAIKVLENIEDEYLQMIYDSLSPKEQKLLKVVTFLHDCGKGRKKDHHMVGASLFKMYAKKLSFSQDEIDMGERLIAYHTLLSNMAQREDIYSQKVILSFASHFPSKKLLDMIYLLTYADMNSVGESIYTSYSSNLIKTLYNNAIDTLLRKELLDESAKRVKKENALKRNMEFKLFKNSQQKKILQIPSNLLFLRYKPQEIIDIASRAFDTQNYTYKITNQTHLSIEVIRTDSLNLSYMLGKLSAFEVVNMDICKLFDEMKYFKIDFSSNATDDEIYFIEEIIHNSFDDTKSIKLSQPIIYKKDIDIDCNHSKLYAKMNLRAKNQKGLLAYLIDIFDKLGIDIATAKVHTIKNRARDMFLIEKNGNFCHNTDVIIDKLTMEE